MQEAFTAGGGTAALGLAEARNLVLEHLVPVSGWESLPLSAALDRVLPGDVVAPFDVPAWDSSAMDGFAIRMATKPGPEQAFQVVGTAEPGRVFTGIVGEGQAVRVLTGAAMPRGADTVVPLECVRTQGSSVWIQDAVEVGQNVRRSGEDLARGSAALPAGRRLGPAELGMLASLGMAEVPVRRRPRVALLSVGEQAASFGRPMGFGEAFDANRYIVSGLLAGMGLELMDLGALCGDPEGMEAAIREASEGADLVLLYSRDASADAWLSSFLGRAAQMAFRHVNIKPGRPLGFGRLRRSWCFCLPVNPVAVMVTYYEIIADALRKLAGESPLPASPGFRARSLSAIRKSPGRCEFLRGNLIREGAETCVRVLAGKGSGVLSSMAHSDCFLVLPEEVGDVAEGDYVMVRPYRGIR